MQQQRALKAVLLLLFVHIAGILLHACPVLLYMSLLSDRRALPTFVAGGVAGCTAAVLTCPLEVIKTKLQSRSLARSSFLHVVRSTWLTEGYKGFFRGLVPLLSGEYPVACPSCVLPHVTFPSGVLPGRALYFSVYTFCKENAATFPVSSHVTHVAAAAAAGITSQTVLSPIYVVKTRLQVLLLRPLLPIAFIYPSVGSNGPSCRCASRRRAAKLQRPH